MWLSNRLTALTVVAVLATACGATADVADDAASTIDDTSATADATEGDTEGDTEVAIDGEASSGSAVDLVTTAGWSDNVTITIDGDTFTFESDGLPSHEYLDQYLADGQDGKYVAGGVTATPTTMTFPLVPTIAASPGTTTVGAIGVAISGAVFFNPYEGDGSSTVANDDNSTIDGIPFIDACGGHPLPNSSTYHYHGIPFCITDAIDTDGEHSQVIGFLLDGHAIYGPQGEDGTEPTDLDACMGHTGAVPGSDAETYHYHVSSDANYISECLTGEFTMSGPGGGRP